MNRFSFSRPRLHRRFALVVGLALACFAPHVCAQAHFDGYIPPAPGYYNAGDVIEIGVKYNDIIEVSGHPRLMLQAGTEVVFARYHNKADIDALNFRYTVAAGVNATSLTVLGLDLNWGAIVDLDAVPVDLFVANTTFPSVLDTTAPAVVAVRRHFPSTPTSTGNVYVFRVSFSEPVAEPTAAAFQLSRSSGLSGGTIDWVRGAGTEWYVSISGVSAGYGFLGLNVLANHITDRAGNFAPAFSAGERFGRLGAFPVAWGSNSTMQINEAGGELPTPIVPPAGALGTQMMATLAMGSYHSLVLTREGNLFAWGVNFDGQLGDSTNTLRTAPVAVKMDGGLAGQQINTIATGSSHSVALAHNGLVFCWGANDWGQLGRGNFVDVNQPVYLADTGTPMAGRTIVAIAAGYQHTLALSADGRVFAWGDNSYGQLGHNSTDDRSNVPVAVDTSGVLAGKHIVAIAAGQNHSLALSSDGQLYAWGRNTYGQLSGTDGESRLVPVEVLRGSLGSRTVVAITAGSNHCLVRTSDGRLYAWGLGSQGQLGISTSAIFRAAVPTAVVATEAIADWNIVAISAGHAFSRALTSDGTVLTWGANTVGQLGKGTIDATNPAGSTNLTPAPLGASAALAHAAVIDLGRGCGGSHSLVLAHPRAATYQVNTPPAGTYGTGAILTFYLAFSENVTVTGTPYLRLGFENRIANAEYVSGSGTTFLTFRCTLQPGDRAPSGIATIDFDPDKGVVDRFGFGVDPQLPGVTTAGIKIDARAPLPLEITRAQPHAVTAAAAVTTANALLYRITFDKVVTGVDAADFALATTGTAAGTISAVLGSGDSRFVVVTGVTGSGALRLDLNPSGTGITDTLGNLLTGGLSTGPAYVHVDTATALGWGANGRDQLATETYGNPVITPFSLPSSGALANKTVTTVATGDAFSLALCSDGTLATWGDNTYDQLGCALSATSSVDPVAVPLTGALSQTKVIAIAAGAEHCLVLTSEGRVYAWGRNDAGQLGTNTGDRDLPTAVYDNGNLAGKEVIAIAAGAKHSLALTADGVLFAWGSDADRQLGNGDGHGSSTTPSAVVMDGPLAGRRVVALAAGAAHSLALDEGGRVYGWGSNDTGQVGNDDYFDVSAPVALPPFASPIVAIGAGAAHSLALSLDGTLFAWGANDRYQLGAGTYDSSRNEPTPVDMTPFGQNIAVSLAAGTKHSLARTADGLLFGWGDNSSAQLTRQFGYSVFTPSALGEGSLATADIVALSTGSSANHSLVLANSGGAPLSLAEQWRLRYFDTPFAEGPSADAADPDADGRTNFVEYATASDPINANSGPVAAPAIAGSGTSRQLTLTFNRIADPTLVYTVEASTTLAPGSWTTIIPPATPLTGPVTVTDPQFMSSHPRRFLRLRIERTP